MPSFGDHYYPTTPVQNQEHLPQIFHFDVDEYDHGDIDKGQDDLIITLL